MNDEEPEILTVTDISVMMRDETVDDGALTGVGREVSLCRHDEKDEDELGDTGDKETHSGR